MEKLVELVLLCKGSVSISFNDHRDSHQSVRDYLQTICDTDGLTVEDIGTDILEEMIRRDTMTHLVVYSDTSIGNYSIYHYDMNKALDIMLGIIGQMMKHNKS